MKKTYLCLFLIAFSALTLEVTLARLLSIIAWYHLAFFALSTAMLGMTAGAIRVYLDPEEFRTENMDYILMKSSFQYSLSIPFILILLCLIPMPLVKTLMSIIALLLATFLCSLPFYFFGIITTTVLTKSSLPIGKLYAADLIGASAGCLFALAGLENMDPPSLLLLCAGIGALAGLCVAGSEQKKLKRRLLVSFVVLFAAAYLNAISFYGIRPLTMKGIMVPPGVIQYERSNSLSRVVVFEEALLDAQLWGPSPVAPKEKTMQYLMNIDGDAATIVRPFKTIKDISHLRYDVVNAAYYLRGSGGACIIGVGGGRDLQSALLFGHKRVVGVDVNPTFINLLKNEFKEYAGLANHDGVQLVADEARSYLTRHQEKFSVLQMSLIDTWASTAAGSFSLSENTLYTLESWKIFIDHLKDDGIFTVSRWHNSKNLGETGRLVSLATASLLQTGVQDASRHLALISANDVSTLLLSRLPFSNEDIQTLKKICSELQFEPSILPGEPVEHPILRSIIASKSKTELSAKVKDLPLNFEPTTDESPYFFNILKVGSIGYLFANSEVWSSFGPGMMMGNMVATLTLTVLTIGLFVVAFFTIIFPILFNKRAFQDSMTQSQVVAPSAAYFALIGAGFMLSEIGLVQRLSIFLGHPVYALGIILFTLILSTGIGSLLSEKIDVNKRSFIILALLTALAILTELFLLKFVIAKFINHEIYPKIALSVLLIFPLGILFGCFFPSGMRLVKNISGSQTPWYWALNGIFGVFCSVLAIFISIYAGISINFYLGACCYLALLPCILILQNKITANSAVSRERVPVATL
jgi:hypothetical protein